MKRIGHIKDKRGNSITLVEAMADYGNVQKSYNKARKGKRYRKDVIRFTKKKEENLKRVREDILTQEYKPGAYHYFKVYEPKERQIMALPFYDRVVQHAINNVLEPIFNKRFIFHSYACRKKKGMHKASETLQGWLYGWKKYHGDEPLYAIKADIHHYFQSIDHGILKAEIRHVIKDKEALTLIDRIIFHSYACRKKKGMHKASETLQGWLYGWKKYHGDEPLYAIKADIHHYFQSIDHGILKAEIRHVIKDKEALTLIDRIIDHNGNMPDGVGIPVGNLTSQLFANIYLDKLDRFIKHTLGVKPYERYMDDFILLSPDKGQLREWLAAIETFLRDELRLELNPKTTILAAKNGIDFVGYKHRGTHKKVRRDSIKRMKRKIKWYVKGKITKEKLQKSVRSWTGHASHADSYNLQKKILTLVARADEQTAAKAA